MPIGDEKIAKFVAAMEDYAGRQSREILRDVENYRAASLLRAEQDILSDCYRFEQKKKDEIRAAIRMDLAKKEAHARHKLIRHRTQIMRAVFAKAGEQILAYKATPAYPDMLKNSLAEMKRRLPETGTVFEMCPTDASLRETLLPLCGEGNTLQTSDDIVLGGLRAINQSIGLSLDDTLDTRLEIQKDWFISHAGLHLQEEGAL